MRKTVNDILWSLHRNFPDHASTFGPCVNKCGNSARGSGKCADCLTKELGQMIDDEGLAFDYLDQLRSTRKLHCEILNKDWEVRQENEDPAGVLR